MATVAHLDSGADTTPTASKASNTFTPTAGSLVVAVCVMSDSTAFDAATCTDSTGRFKMQRLEAQVRFAASAHKVDVFVADVAADATSRTLTFNAGSDAATGFTWEIFEINGISRFGGDAVRQQQYQFNQAAGGTPTTSFGGVALTGNVCAFIVGNNSSPAGVTAPANFTGRANTGYSTPTTGLHVSTRDSGHTSQTITAGSTSATTFGTHAIEFDCTSTETVLPFSTGTQPATTGTGTGTTSCAPDYPPGLAEGHGLLMAVGIKPDTATAPTITDWTKVANTEASGGGGTTGTDAGPTRVCWYIYDPDGDGSGVGASPPAGTLTVTPGNSPNCCWAMMFAFSSPHGADVLWEAAGHNGIDSTTGATFTAAMGGDPGVAIGDLLIFAGVTPTDVNLPTPPVYKMSQLVLTGTSFTHGRHIDALTRYEPSTTSGQDLGGIIFRSPVLTAAAGALTPSLTVGGTTTNIRGPIALCRLRATAADTGIEEPLAQASETDTAQTLDKAKEKALGLNAETDTAQALSAAKTKDLGQATAETDEAQALVVQKSHEIQVSETDTAQAFTSAKEKALGQAEETDVALPMAAMKTKAIGQAEETDETFAVASAKTRDLGIASELDAVIPFVAPQEVALETAEETDVALPMAAAKTKELGVASEDDAAQTLAGAKEKALEPAEELDTALGLNVQGNITEPLEIASETDLAQALAAEKTKDIGQAEDEEVALPMTALKTKTIGQAIEAGVPLPFVRVKEKALGQAEETDAPLEVLRLKSLSIGQAVEAAETFAFARMKEKALGVAGELDEAPPFVLVSFVADVSSSARARAGVTSGVRATASITSGVEPAEEP